MTDSAAKSGVSGTNVVKEKQTSDADTGTAASTIPDHRRYWESSDFTITKTVLEEGELDSWKPRFGSTGEVRLELSTVSGLPLDQLSCLNISKYFLNPAPALTEDLRNVFDASFCIGAGETEIDRQVERCIQTCYPGQVAQFTLRVLLEPELNGGSGTVSSIEPEWIILDFELTLTSLLNADPIYKWFNETKLAKAREFHSAGVRLFKERRHLDSFHMFKHAYRLAVLARGLETDEFAEAKAARELQQLCYNNIAACHFQWNNHKSVVDLSDLVLEVQPNMVKTLYRRGVSNMALQEYDLAEKDLILARKLEPTNRAVNEKLGQAQQRKKAADAKLAQRMSKMFAS